MANKEKQETSLAVIEGIEEKIYLIRGQKVMLDSDLAEVYNVTTKRLNEQVKRNIDRFPEDFMFQLTEQEVEKMRSQFATASKRNVRFRPYVFTEHGAVMLASVLNSPTAIEASIEVVRAFIKMRSCIASGFSRKARKIRENCRQTRPEFCGNFAIVKSSFPRPEVFKTQNRVY